MARAMENNTTALFKRLQKTDNIQLKIKFRKLGQANLDMFRNREAYQILKDTFKISDSKYETSEKIITLKGNVTFEYTPGYEYHNIEANIQYHQSPLIFKVFYRDIERGSLKIMNDPNNNVNRGSNNNRNNNNNNNNNIAYFRHRKSPSKKKSPSRSKKLRRTQLRRTQSI